MSDANKELRSQLEEFVNNAFDEKTLQPFKKQLDDMATELCERFEYGVKDYAAYNLAAYVQEMAEKSVVVCCGATWMR